MKFEFLVAVRYLKAKRKQAVISLITFISIVGVCAGVAALIIALAFTTGFREDLETEASWRAAARSNILRRRLEAALPITCGLQKRSSGYRASSSPRRPCIRMWLSSEAQATGVVLKGVIAEMESRLSALSKNMVEGNLTDFQEDSVIIGKELSKKLGSFHGDQVKAVSLERDRRH